MNSKSNLVKLTKFSEIIIPICEMVAGGRPQLHLLLLPLGITVKLPNLEHSTENEVP